METKVEIAYGIACHCGCEGVMAATDVCEHGMPQREVFILYKDPKEAMKEAVNYGCNSIKKVEIRVIEK